MLHQNRFDTWRNPGHHNTVGSYNSTYGECLINIVYGADRIAKSRSTKVMNNTE